MRPGVLLVAPLMLLSLLAGCHITNHAYRDGVGRHSAPVIQVPASEVYLQDKHPVYRPCNKDPKQSGDTIARAGSPCLAFLEFDDMGEAYRSQTTGRDDQLAQAVKLISNTQQYAAQHPKDVDLKPVVLVFIHGWKHNAGPDDLNVKGFEQILNYLAGRKIGDQDELCPGPQFVQDRCVYARHPIIGVYIGWRGDLYSKYLPVMQDLSVWDRGKAATRVSVHSIAESILAISKATGHLPEPGKLITEQDKANRSTLIYIGHSFGGLILERATAKAVMHEIEASTPETFTPVADLILYVNPASDATESKPTLDFMAQKQFRYDVCKKDAVTQKSEVVQRPVMLSVTTPADAATKYLLPFESFTGQISEHMDGSYLHKDPLACFDPEQPASRPAVIYSQNIFSNHSAPHMQQLQSHDFTELVDKQTHQSIPCPMDTSSYPSGWNFVRTIPGRCYVVVPKPNRCNGTPYWIMDTDRELIPDHGTIFTGRLLNFIGLYLPILDAQSNDKNSCGTKTGFHFTNDMPDTLQTDLRQ